MSEAKPFASLSSGLLARKGAAKPAMRRPHIGFNSNNNHENGQDDLGWNDMGYDVDPDISGEIPAERPTNPLAKAIERPKPEVKQQQERIAAQLKAMNTADEEALVENNSELHLVTTQESNVKNLIKSQSTEYKEEKNTSLPAQPMAKKPIISKKERVSDKSRVKTKAAFTLRLDPERHLKLRLACAINNISAQKFVTEALDRKLKEMDQIDYLSDQIIEK